MNTKTWENEQKMIKIFKNVPERAVNSYSARYFTAPVAPFPFGNELFGAENCCTAPFVTLSKNRQLLNISNP